MSWWMLIWMFSSQNFSSSLSLNNLFSSNSIHILLHRMVLGVPICMWIDQGWTEGRSFGRRQKLFSLLLLLRWQKLFGRRSGRRLHIKKLCIFFQNSAKVIFCMKIFFFKKKSFLSFGLPIFLSKKVQKISGRVRRYLIKRVSIFV